MMGSRNGRAVEIIGGADPVLPTPFRIGAAGAAALAATGLAAADLWESRTGWRQQVTVDLRQSGASLRSGHYLQVNGVKVRERTEPGDGHVPGQERPLELPPRQFPEPSCCGAAGARLASGPPQSRSLERLTNGGNRNADQPLTRSGGALFAGTAGKFYRGKRTRRPLMLVNNRRKKMRGSCECVNQLTPGRRPMGVSSD
jgi:hypothetical protein